MKASRILLFLTSSAANSLEVLKANSLVPPLPALQDPQ
jgi:hypothetical protein